MLELLQNEMCEKGLLDNQQAATARAHLMLLHHNSNINTSNANNNNATAKKTLQAALNETR